MSERNPTTLNAEIVQACENALRAVIERVMAEAAHRTELPIQKVEIGAETKDVKPIQWQTTVCYYDRKGKYQVSVKTADTLADSIADCLENIPVAPDLAVILGLHLLKNEAAQSDATQAAQ